MLRFALGTLVCLGSFTAPSLAQTTSAQVYVSAYGLDDAASICTDIAAPCLSPSFAAAYLTSGGIMTILTDGNFGGIYNITGGVTVVGQGPGTVIANPRNAGFTVTGQYASLTLRNLAIRAPYNSAARVGVDFTNGSYLSMENVTIDNQLDVAATGVRFVPPGNAVLVMKGVTIENAGNASTGGAVVVGASTSGVTHRVHISDSLFDSDARGIVVQGTSNVRLSIEGTSISSAAGNGITVATNGGATKLTIKNSQIVSNAGNGVMIAPTGNAKVETVVMGSTLDGNVIGLRSFPASPATSTVSISDSSVSNNVGGVHASGNSNVGIIRGNVSSNSSYGITAVAPAAIRVGSSMVNGNALGLSGPVSSYGNNQLLGNTTPGSATAVPPGGVP